MTDPAEVLDPSEIAEHRWRCSADRVSRRRLDPLDPDAAHSAVVADLAARYGEEYAARVVVILDRERDRDEPAWCDHEELVYVAGRAVCLACGSRRG